MSTIQFIHGQSALTHNLPFFVMKMCSKYLVKCFTAPESCADSSSLSANHLQCVFLLSKRAILLFCSVCVSFQAPETEVTFTSIDCSCAQAHNSLRQTHFGDRFHEPSALSGFENTQIVIANHVYYSIYPWPKCADT